MNKAEFHIILENPSNLNKSHLGELKHVIADFPYFQAAHVVMLRTLHNLNNHDFDKYLQYTAIAVPDREVLYNYLHGIKKEHKSLVTTPTVPTFVAPPTVQEAFTEPKVEESITEPAEELQTETTVDVDQPQTESPVEPVLETTASSQTTSIVEETQPTLTTEPEPVAETEAVQPEPTAEPPVVVQFDRDKHSFVEWLKLMQQQQIVVTEPQQEQQQPERTPQPEAESVSNDVVDQTKKNASNINEFESILDKFIRENPRISRPKAEFYSPANMAKQSVEEDEQLVTETLAQLYYKQGAYKKAIRAYEKLCLLYPHRIAYFADLIQKIKTENKD